jgi:hypothetical protein
VCKCASVLAPLANDEESAETPGIPASRNTKYRISVVIACIRESITLLYVYIVSQQIHYSNSLLISYSSYMFRRMYVIIGEPSFVCPAELN